MAEEASTSKTKKRILSVLQTTSEGQAPLKKSRLVPTGPKYEGEELKLSFHGILYQLHLLTLFLKRGVDRGYTFILGSEVTAAEKFDDVVFRYEEDGTYNLRFFQAKHKRDENEKITRQDLVKTVPLTGKSKNLDFSIQKYFLNYKKFKLRREKEMYLKGNIQNFTICTNIDIDQSLEENFEEIDVSNDPLLSFDADKQGRSLKLKYNSPLYNELVGILSREYELLAKNLGTLIADNSNLKYNKNILDHKHWILKNIFDPRSLVHTGKKHKKYYLNLRKEFVLNNNENKFSKKFFEVFIKRGKDTKYLLNEKIQIFPNFVEALRSDKTTESEKELNESQLSEDIYFFLHKLVFALRQPSENELKDIIETEMATLIKLPDGELAASIVRTRLQDWFKEKEGQFLTNTDCRNLFEDLENIVAFLCQIGITLKTEKTILKNSHKNCSFKNDFCAVKTINDFIYNEDYNKRVLLVYYDVRLLTEIKVLQLRENYQSNNFMWADIKDYIEVLNSVACPVKAFKSNACKKMFVMQNEITTETKKLLKSIFEIMKREKDKKLMVILPVDKREEFIQKTRDVLNGKYDELEDLENSFDDFCVETQNSLRRNAKLVFNGYTLGIEKLLSYNTMLQNLTGDVLSGLVSGKYEFAIDNSNDHYDKTKKYYIKRRLLSLSKPDAKGFVVERLNNLNDPLIVITGEPGSGKSSLLSHVATKTKEIQLKNPLAEKNKCIINVTLQNYVTQLFHQEKDSGEITSIKAVRFLYIISGLQVFDESKECKIVFEFDTNGGLAASMHSGQTPLHLRLFQYLYNNKKIILFFDGFDEIAPHYAERVCDYLIKFKDMRIQKMWVTTRPYDIQNNLKSKKCGTKRSSKKYNNFLNATPYMLMPLSKLEQEKLLKIICEQKKNLKKNKPIDFNDLQQFCKGMPLIDRNRKVTKTETHDFLSTPQQLIMLAKIYNKEGINLSPERKKITIYSLYEKCVDIYFNKLYKEITRENCKYRTDYDRIYRSFTKRHEQLAFLELFSNLDIELPFELVPRTNQARLIAKVNKGEEKTGLIVSATDGKSSRFVHRTYAEFFAARRLANEVYPDDKKKKKKNDDQLSPHSPIKFLYKIMCSGTISHLFLAFFNYHIIDRMLKEKQKRKSNTTTADTVFTAESANILKAAIEGDVNILDSEKCVNLRDAFGRNPIYLAISSCSTEDCKLLVEKHLRNFSSILTKDGLFQWTALHYFMLFSHNNLSDIFSISEINFDNEDDFKDREGQTPLMLALGKNDIDVSALKFVINFFRRIVNTKDNFGKTAAHKVIANIDKYRANSMALTLLISKANFYLSDNEGKTPLDILFTKKVNSVNIAAIKRMILFLFKGNKSKIVQTFFTKCIHCENWCVFLLTINPEVSEAMLNLMEANGLTVNLRDSEAKSALHRSIPVYQTKNKQFRSFSIKNYCFLLQKGADVRALDNCGKSPSDYWTDCIFEKIREHTEDHFKKKSLENKFSYGYYKLLEMKNEFINNNNNIHD